MRKHSLVLVVALVALAVGGLPFAGATHSPADKVAVAGSTLEVMTAPIAEGATSERHTLLAGSLRTSSPTDLILQVTAECALLTDVTNVGNSDSQSTAQVKIWIEIDEQPVGVTGGDNGEVVFCNRAFRVVITDLDDEDATFQHFLRTRAANAFNWITLNVGSGIHSIAVLAQLEATVTGAGMAQAIVGKRTLVVEPTKLANDASI